MRISFEQVTPFVRMLSSRLLQDLARRIWINKDLTKILTNLTWQSLSRANQQLHHYPSPPIVPKWYPSTELGQYPSNMSGLQAHPSPSLQYVKDHHHRTTHFWSIPLEAQLSTQADKLATAFQEKSRQGTDRGQMIPRSGCQLVMENQAIRSNHLAGF
jgi:hypothetical protein